MEPGQINELLNLTLEIEGLLMLLKERDESAPAEVMAMLREKAGRLGSSLNSDSGAATAEPDLTPEADSRDDDAEEAVESEQSQAIAEAAAANAAADEEAEAESTAWEERQDADSRPLRLDEKFAREGARDIHHAFTVNDRFRFRRELFSNSESRLADALDIIAAMNSLDEAEEYFYNDLCWDRESTDVKDFMTIVANHFDADAR